jgi:ATP-dependent Clp protease protease subunit
MSDKKETSKRNEDKYPFGFIDKYKILLEDAIDLENKVIYLFGDLEEDLGTLLRLKFRVLQTYWKDERDEDLKEITIDISSFGGSIYSIFAAIDFYDELRFNNIPVHTRAQGICMSAATLLLFGGTGKRVASKRCKLMLHDIQVEGLGGSATQMQKNMETLKKEQEELFQFYAQFSREKGTEELKGSKLKTETKKWINRIAKNSIEHHMSAKDALDLNLIDDILYL